ncbi:MAG: isoamylase early set domain-containing protein [Kiritimatiellae bacterium]|nr:isoamylase early set domain-containing protein [Kiritimatiellia bacterium]
MPVKAKTEKKAKAPKKSEVVKAKATKKSAAVKAAPAAKKAAKQRVTFTLAADAGSEVFLAGDFNNWDPTAKRMVDKDGTGAYSTVVTLAPGEYEYKFVINGIWCVDPNCREWRQNSLGTLNSVLHV